VLPGDDQQERVVPIAIETILATESPFDAAQARKSAMREEAQTASERKKNEQLLKEQDVQAVLQRIRSLLKKSPIFNNLFVTDNNVREVLDLMHTLLSEPEKFRAIAQAMEGEGLTDTLIENLPVGDLHSEIARSASGALVDRRKVFLRLIARQAVARGIESVPARRKVHELLFRRGARPGFEFHPNPASGGRAVDRGKSCAPGWLDPHGNRRRRTPLGFRSIQTTIPKAARFCRVLRGHCLSPGHGPEGDCHAPAKSFARFAVRHQRGGRYFWRGFENRLQRASRTPDRQRPAYVFGHPRAALSF
jgi:hypothetical protein